MKKVAIIISLFIAVAVCSFRASAAERSRFQFELEYNYGVGLSVSDNLKDGSFGSSTIMFEVLYNINRRFTTGLGVGISAGSIATTIPVHAMFRYRPFDKPVLKDFYAFTNLGFQPTSIDSDANNNSKMKVGFIADVGIGWQKMFRRHFGIDLKLGYSYRRASAKYVEIAVDETTGAILGFNSSRFGVDCNYFSFGVGLVF